MGGILFLCVANAARSQLAEAIARELAPEGVEVHSAGTAPGGLHPMAVRVLSERGLDAQGQRSKSVDEIPMDRIDTVVTLCAEEACPVWLGHARRLHWPLPDPAAHADEVERLAAFRSVRDELFSRIREHFE